VIEWTTVEKLDERLRRYPPIGVRLRPWFHARSESDPASVIERAPEIRNDDGLGEASVWSGLVDEVPFALRSMAHSDSDYGFEVWFPKYAGGDGRLVAALANLPLPAWRQPYFDSLPIASGSGVVRVGDDTPIYTTTMGEDAAAVAAFVNKADVGKFVVVPVGAGEPQWVVVGPRAGPFISWLDTTSSVESAERLAAKWSADTGATFRVRRYMS
jgi:hypothetical protein